jgi:hypothetical protein
MDIAAGNIIQNKVDVATPTNNRFSIVAVVCRDHDGFFLGAYVIVFKHINDPPTLEALAIQEALALAEDLNLQRIHVASDYKVVVDDIEQRRMTGYGAITHENHRL